MHKIGGKDSHIKKKVKSKGEEGVNFDKDMDKYTFAYSVSQILLICSTISGIACSFVLLFNMTVCVANQKGNSTFLHLVGKVQESFGLHYKTSSSKHGIGILPLRSAISAYFKSQVY
ncbi:hypothetical protein K501DRAFT_305368 [Backusella circina FSU 941]|nr:hypothetical protein K501DRAFT_305368 [Backusella circina FSU 941]